MRELCGFRIRGLLSPARGSGFSSAPEALDETLRTIPRMMRRRSPPADCECRFQVGVRNGWCGPNHQDRDREFREISTGPLRTRSAYKSCRLIPDRASAIPLCSGNPWPVQRRLLPPFPASAAWRGGQPARCPVPPLPPAPRDAPPAPGLACNPAERTRIFPISAGGVSSSAFRMRNSAMALRMMFPKHTKTNDREAAGAVR